MNKYPGLNKIPHLNTDHFLKKKKTIILVFLFTSGVTYALHIDKNFQMYFFIKICSFNKAKKLKWISYSIHKKYSITLSFLAFIGKNKYPLKTLSIISK